MIEVTPVDEVPEDIVLCAKQGIEEVLGLGALLLNPVSLPLDVPRIGSKIDADSLIGLLPGPSRGNKRVYLVPFDATVRGLNFVFGLSEMGGRKCIVFLFRLFSKNRSLFCERVKKEVIHELGHTFGLGHCKDMFCVMSFSNSLLDVDRKKKEFCLKCKEKLKLLSPNKV